MPGLEQECWWDKADMQNDRYNDSSSDLNQDFEQQDNRSLTQGEDMVMEQILENIHNTPIGQVLKKISALPEIRQEKVLDVRDRITKGEYDLNSRLNVALDKVLEDLTT